MGRIQFGAFLYRYFLMNPIAPAEDQREQIEAIAADILPRFRS